MSEQQEAAERWSRMFEWRKELLRIIGEDMEGLTPLDPKGRPISGAATTKLVGLALSTYANADGQCFPGVPRLARECAVHERTIQKALSALEAVGFIETDRGRNRGGRSRNGRGRTSYFQLIPFGTNPGDAPGYAEILAYVAEFDLETAKQVATPAQDARTPATDSGRVAQDATTPALSADNPGTAPPEVDFEVVSESEIEIVLESGAPDGARRLSPSQNLTAEELAQLDPQFRQWQERVQAGGGR